MIEELFDEAKDFFEDLYEHLFTAEYGKGESAIALRERTRLAYLFSERIDGFMKIVFGGSIAVSAFVASIWGIPAVGDMVRVFTTNILGRLVLLLIGLSYIVNGLWRLLSVTEKKQNDQN